MTPSPLGGGYLLSHFRSTIGVVRLNFSVRNGKRWDPHAMTTLSFYLFQPGRRIVLRRGCDDQKKPSGERYTRQNLLRDFTFFSQRMTACAMTHSLFPFLRALLKSAHNRKAFG